MGAVGAALLLCLHHLTSARVGRLAVVRPIVEVDRDIDGFLRNEGTDLAADREREGALGPAEHEMAEEPSGGAVRVSSAALGPGAVDRGTKDGRPEEQIAGVTYHSGAEGPARRGPQERKEPGEGFRTDLPIRQGAGPPSRAVGR
jgi:hypothetical protein